MIRLSSLLTLLIGFACWASPAGAQIRYCGCHQCRSISYRYVPYPIYSSPCLPSYPTYASPYLPYGANVWYSAGTPYVVRNYRGNLQPVRPLIEKPAEALPMPGGNPMTTVKKAPTKMDILSLGASRSDLSILMQLAADSGLAQELSGEGPYTIFAPTNQAFQALPPGTLEALQADRVKLKDVLLLHAATESITAADLTKLTEIETAANQKVKVERLADGQHVGGARLIESDHKCTNGVVHIVNRVILPPEASGTSEPPKE